MTGERIDAHQMGKHLPLLEHERYMGGEHAVRHGDRQRTEPALSGEHQCRFAGFTSK